MNHLVDPISTRPSGPPTVRTTGSLALPHGLERPVRRRGAPYDGRPGRFIEGLPRHARWYRGAVAGIADRVFGRFLAVDHDESRDGASFI